MMDAPLPPVVLAPVFLGMLITFSVFSIQTGDVTDALGSLRAVLPPILAAPFVLLAAWHMEQVPLNPQNVRVAANAAQLLGGGLLILLAPAPLHSAQPQLGESSPPVATALYDSLLPDSGLICRLSGSGKLPAAAEQFRIQPLAEFDRNYHLGLGRSGCSGGKPSRPSLGLCHAA